MRRPFLALVLLALVAALPAAAARAPGLGYALRGDTLVFRFRPAEYRMAVSDRSSRWMQLSELRVRQVAVAGPWNQWSAVAWPLHATRRGDWVLRCPLSSVADHDTIPFKFVVNGEWWVQPPPDTPNQLNAGIGDTTMNLFFVRPRAPGRGW
jgi:hypothetical protein